MPKASSPLSYAGLELVSSLARNADERTARASESARDPDGVARQHGVQSCVQAGAPVIESQSQGVATAVSWAKESTKQRW